MPTRKTPAFFSPDVSRARRFYLDLAPPADCELAVVCGGYEDCQADYAIRRRSFPYFSLELVSRGKGELVLEGMAHALERGAVFTYGPTTPHAIRTHRQSRLGKYFVDFAGTAAEPLLADAGLGVGATARVATAPEVELVFNELIRDGQRGDRWSPELCVALLRCLLLRVGANRIEPGPDAPEPYETYRRCVDYIDTHAVTLTSQRQAAAECGVTPSYLSRLFKRHSSQSPYQYLTRVRMTLAADRLRETDDLVQEIAGQFGFTDPFHFSRAFKATFGVSPTAFRSLR